MKMRFNHTARTLREIRKRQGISRAKLAAKSGLSESLIDKVERGERSLGLDASAKAARALKVDQLQLYIATNVAGIKASVVAGESPTRAAAVARTLVELLEIGDLTVAQRRAVRSALQELVTVVEDVAEQRGAGTVAGLAATRPQNPPSRDVEDPAQRFDADLSYSDEYREKMDELGRDLSGRKLEKPKRSSDAIDDYYPDLDYVQKSGGATLNEQLGRDSFGRKIDQ